MERRKMLDLYSDYLISSFSHTTATGLSKMLNETVSHDQVTRFLSRNEFSPKDLWKEVKPTLRRVETDDGVIAIDDCIAEKEHTDENELICWHYDHSKGRTVKGLNILNFLYVNDKTSIPISYELIKKDQIITNKKTGRKERKSSITKNELTRKSLKQIKIKQVKFKYVLADIWFSAKDNMDFIKKNLKKDFIFAIKKNRLVALSKKDKLEGRFESIESLNLSDNNTCEVWLKGVDFPTVLVKQVFKNKDGSIGILYLVSSDTNLDFNQIVKIYQKRWKIEEYHKSIKQNSGLTKSPTKTVRTQSNHFFMAIYTFFKLEKLKLKTELNHFSMKSILYVNVLKASYQTLQQIKAEAGA